MKNYGIHELYGMAWGRAIANVGRAIEVSRDWIYPENWRYIERVADRLGVRFDCNGEIVIHKEVA